MQHKIFHRDVFHLHFFFQMLLTTVSYGRSEFEQSFATMGLVSST